MYFKQRLAEEGGNTLDDSIGGLTRNVRSAVPGDGTKYEKDVGHLRSLRHGSPLQSLGSLASYSSVFDLLVFKLLKKKGNS